MGLSVSGSYPVIIADIRDKSYKIMYEDFPMQHLVKKIAQGAKGNAVNWPYWDPSAVSQASTLTEGTDISSTTAYTNASVYMVASEFGTRSLITYNVQEDERSGGEIRDAHAYRHGIACGMAKDKKLLAHFSGFSGNTVTATSTSGFNITHVMNAYTQLDEGVTRVPRPINFVVHPRAWYYFGKGEVSNTNYGVRGELGEDVLAKFHLGTLMGEIRVFTDPQISISSSIATCAMFSPDAIGLWTPRKYQMKSDEDISLRAIELVSTERVGSAELVDVFGCKFTAYAGALS